MLPLPLKLSPIILLYLTTLLLLSEVLEVLSGSKLTWLDLSENGLDDKESLMLSNSIYKLNQLQHLDLAGSAFTGRGTVS